MPYLIFRRRGQFLMQVMVHERDGTTVGSSEAEVTVDDPAVAPIQAGFVPDGDRWRLIDRAGKRTVVEGKLFDTVFVGEGATIAFGECEATFTFKPLVAPPSPTAETSPLTRVDGDLPQDLQVVAEIPGKPGSRREAPFPRGQELEIGSAVGVNGLLLPFDGISRKHATLFRNQIAIMLHDKKSTNGTWCAAGKVYELALRLGARFMIRPFELWVEVPPKRGRVKPPNEKATFAKMITSDPATKLMFAEIERVALLPIPVVIHGESGTGKELVARALHDHSDRRHKPFVKLNCANLTGDMVEAALFGHKKGGFTGAIASREGAFLKANGGTLFLDEVAELPLLVQAKLLHAVESGEINPVGSDDELLVDVRIVVASHASLINEVHAKRFRADLFYRLNCALIELPALRDRKGDVRLLWNAFMEVKRPIEAPTTSPAAFEKLILHDWPGNIRELNAVMERALVRLCERTTLEPDDILIADPNADQSLGDLVDVRGKSWDDIEKAVIAAVMRGCKGNRREAARLLKINRATVSRMLEKYGLERMGKDEEEGGEE